MQVTVEQLKAAEQGEAVKIEAGGKKYVLLTEAKRRCQPMDLAKGFCFRKR